MPPPTREPQQPQTRLTPPGPRSTGPDGRLVRLIRDSSTRVVAPSAGGFSGPVAGGGPNGPQLRSKWPSRHPPLSRPLPAGCPRLAERSTWPGEFREATVVEVGGSPGRSVSATWTRRRGPFAPRTAQGWHGVVAVVVSRVGPRSSRSTSMARSFYKGEPLGKLPPCAICVGAGRGGRAELHLPGGVSVWLCADHRSEEFQCRRAGRDLVASLMAVWRGAGCFTARRSRALDLHRARLRNRALPRDLPGSYAWPDLRREAEALFASGHRPAEVIARLRERERRGPARPPSVRTMRRWFRDGRWLAGPPGPSSSPPPPSPPPPTGPPGGGAGVERQPSGNGPGSASRLPAGATPPVSPQKQFAFVAPPAGVRLGPPSSPGRAPPGADPGPGAVALGGGGGDLVPTHEALADAHAARARVGFQRTATGRGRVELPLAPARAAGDPDAVVPIRLALVHGASVSRGTGTAFGRVANDHRRGVRPAGGV